VDAELERHRARRLRRGERQLHRRAAAARGGGRLAVDLDLVSPPILADLEALHVTREPRAARIDDQVAVDDEVRHQAVRRQRPDLVLVGRRDRLGLIGGRHDRLAVLRLDRLGFRLRLGLTPAPARGEAESQDQRPNELAHVAAA
jgi:hypothetical protein